MKKFMMATAVGTLAGVLVTTQVAGPLLAQEAERAPFRTVALEQRAVALLDAGDKDAALKQLQDLLQEPGVNDAMRNRTQQLIIALGGDLPDAFAGSGMCSSTPTPSRPWARFP